MHKMHIVLPSLFSVASCSPAASYQSYQFLEYNLFVMYLDFCVCVYKVLFLHSYEHYWQKVQNKKKVRLSLDGREEAQNKIQNKTENKT